MSARPLRILFVAPAFWPATAFGGPIDVMRELAAGLVADGHRVDVVTTTLDTVGQRARARGRVCEVDGATVRYLGTPVRYRWMGLTPALPAVLHRLPRPDVVHVFGYRDPLGTAVAAWCIACRIPYVFEGLGMFAPKLRKVALKRALDASLYAHVPRGAAAIVAASTRERHEYALGGVPQHRVVVRPNGFPAPRRAPRSGALRLRLGIDREAPLVVSVGRVAAGKGLELLVEAVAGIDDVHLAIVGPDDGHGVQPSLERLAGRLGAQKRVHLVGHLPRSGVDEAYGDADVVALVSRHESFGMVAAEAASAGVAVVVSDRCGVAELLSGEGAIVVRYERGPLQEALSKTLADGELRRRLGEGGQAVARRWPWPRVVALQEEIYLSVVSRLVT